VDASPAGQSAPSAALCERLTREWLARIVERTPLAEVADLPYSRLAAVGPRAVAAVTAALAAETPSVAAEGFPIGELARLRGTASTDTVAGDLASLQRVLVGELRREHAEPAAFAAAVERLADLFGALQGAVARELIATGAPPASVDAVTGLPGPAQLEGWLGALLAEQRRYGHPFALALIDIDGLARVNDAYGRGAGDRMLAAVAAILRRQLRDVDQAFRLEEDEFAVIAPHTDAARLVAMGKRVAGVITRSQDADGPRIAIAAGIVDCPADGVSAERLLESATEAIYAAKAAGAPVARSAVAADTALQDP